MGAGDHKKIIVRSWGELQLPSQNVYPSVLSFLDSKVPARRLKRERLRAKTHTK
jgi:hypothetical protein